jgi:hypothetical protein
MENNLPAQVVCIREYKKNVEMQKEARRRVVAGVVVEEPTTRQEYLDICKRLLPVEDYMMVLVGILDVEYYACDTPERLQRVIDQYQDFEY